MTDFDIEPARAEAERKAQAEFIAHVDGGEQNLAPDDARYNQGTQTRKGPGPPGTERSTHHSGWSIKTLQLFYYSRKTNGTWSAELIADKADGYVGGDGNQYTGLQVQLSFNAFGHPYVAFGDLASWHITYNYRAPGQIRYAIKACGKWHHHTVFKQKGQTVSPNPIYACRHPMLTPGHDGQTMLFACVEHVIPDATASATTVTANLHAIRASQLMK